LPKRADKGGNRAEVRRERKKRDILSPVNVLQYLVYQKALYKAVLFLKKMFVSDEIMSAG